MAEKIASQILAIVLVKTLGSLMESATGRHPARPGGLPRDCCRILEPADSQLVLSHDWDVNTKRH